MSGIMPCIFVVMLMSANILHGWSYKSIAHIIMYSTYCLIMRINHYATGLHIDYAVDFTIILECTYTFKKLTVEQPQEYPEEYSLINEASLLWMTASHM